MIAIVNSLSMYATHKGSDIDLFIVTEKGMIWLVRFLVTITLWCHGVWRHGEDIAGNFCLSFLVTTDHISLQDIRIDDDVYLYYWIYYMKPIVARGDIYDRFLMDNAWVDVDALQRKENLKFLASQTDDIKEMNFFLRFVYMSCNSIIRLFWLPKTLSTYRKLGKPE